MIVEVDGITYDTDAVKIKIHGKVLEVTEPVDGQPPLLLAYEAGDSPSDGNYHFLFDLVEEE